MKKTKEDYSPKRVLCGLNDFSRKQHELVRADMIEHDGRCFIVVDWVRYADRIEPGMTIEIDRSKLQPAKDTRDVDFVYPDPIQLADGETFQ